MTWHPATEPPSDGRDVQVILDNGAQTTAYYSADGGIWHTVACGFVSPVEWTELPPGPGTPDAAQALADALRRALIEFATFKITDAEKPYFEISPVWRKSLLETHDIVLAALAAFERKGAAQ